MLRVFVALLLLTAAGCTGVEYFAANAPTVLGSYNRTVDLPFGEAKRQRLDVYAPRHAVNRPVVIFWYGGRVRGRRSPMGSPWSEHFGTRPDRALPEADAPAGAA